MDRTASCKILRTIGFAFGFVLMMVLDVVLG
jgi:hypothetical protein